MSSEDTLPEGWEETTLSEVSVVRTGKFKTADDITPPPYLKFKGLKEDRSHTTETGRTDGVLAYPGDTVVSRQGHVTGWVLKKVSMPLEERVIANGSLAVIGPKGEVSSGWLNIVLSAASIYSEVTARQGEKPSLDKEAYGGTKVFKPCLEEQQRIVDLITTADNYITDLKAEHTAAVQARKSLVEELLQPQEGWEETTINQSCEVLNKLRRAINSTERAERPGTVPYFGATGQAGWIDRHVFDEPLVLLGEDAVDFGSPSATKAYCIDGPSWVNNHAHVLRPGPGLHSNTMLTLLLNAVDYTKYAVFGTRSKLTKGSMVDIVFPLPPLDEQQRIVELVTTADNYISGLAAEIEAAEATRKSLVDDLLTGRKRV